MNILAHATILGGSVDPRFTPDSMGFSSVEAMEPGRFRVVLSSAPEVPVRWSMSSPYSDIVLALQSESDTDKVIETRRYGEPVDVAQFSILLTEAGT